ncbi:MAG: family 78 glycoside hydrolase catalytic domain, partial [Clostridiales bacterium]|nr:family 78 glycoside hydrolase catalytic domain [Clostridiales bacterium]
MKHTMKSILSVLLCLTMIFSMAAASAVPATAVGEADFLLTGLTTEYQEEPVGLDTDTPRFSWKMLSNRIGAKQTAYQVIVTSEAGETVWDSGRVISDQSVAVAYAGAGLKGQTSYTWQVTVWDESGTEASAAASFTTGVKGDWGSARWVIPSSQEGGSAMLRTEQPLRGNVQSARLYVTALGIYEAYINGVNVSRNDMDDVLNPGWTDYNFHVNYQGYDVTELVSGNSVALGVFLGKGWYGGTIGSVGSYGKVIGDADKNELALLAKLVITYEDGSMQEIVTGEDGWVSTGETPVISNDYYDGESYDANRESALKGWTEPGFDASGWSRVTTGVYTGEVRASARASAYFDDSVMRTPVEAYTYSEAEILSPQEAGNDFGAVVRNPVDAGGDIALKAGDVLILDMGQNMVGVNQLSVSGPSGAVVTMKHAEMLNDGRKNPNVPSGGSDGADGTLYIKALKAAAATDTYTLSGEAVQIYRPLFTYHGYRYTAVTADQDIMIHSAQGHIITSATKQTGTLETSDPYVNQLVSNTLWSQRGNFTTLPTDCPQRNERTGWTGDAQLFCQTAMYNFDVTAFFENYIEMMNTHAANKGDAYHSIMPTAYLPFLANIIACGWSDAGVIIPWTVYQQTGDITMVTTYYDQMDAYMDKVGIVGYNTGKYGDWLAFYGASIPYMNAVYRIYTVTLMEKMAEATANEDGTAKYNALYDELKTEFLNKYVDEAGNVLSSSADGVTVSQHGYPVVDNAQTALLWVLKLGLYQDGRQKETMVRNLLANIRNENGEVRPEYGENTLSVGFLGVNVILPVLTDIGCADVAYDLLLQDQMPSWLYSVKNGATTIWERWNSYSIEDSFGDSGMNSFNHYSYGACLEWMYEYMAGISADETNPGFKNTILAPVVDEQNRLTYAKGSYESYYGNIVSGWTADNGTMTTYEAVVPANTTATLYLPVEAKDVVVNTSGVTYVGDDIHNGQICAKFELTSGGYDFAIEDGIVTVNVKDSYVDDSTVVKSAIAPESAQVNADFDVTVVTAASVADVRLFNANGLAIGRKAVDVIDNEDGTKTWTI